MPLKNTVGHVVLTKDRIPGRHFGRELDATSELWKFSSDFRKLKLDDVELLKPEVQSADQTFSKVWQCHSGGPLLGACKAQAEGGIRPRRL